MKKISVLMGIYNCEATLERAILSIVHQSYPEWELIMCDDGSTDGTKALAKRYCSRYPQKMRLLVNPVNKGLNYTLNRCLEVASGEYIARQDGDDLSCPNRFEVQLRFLQEHRDLAVVGSGMILFDSEGDWGIGLSEPLPSSNSLMRGSPFSHATCMMRRDVLLAVNGYSVDDRLLRVEDYHLWYKMYRAGFRGANVPDILYRCQDDRAALGRRTFRNRLNECYVKSLILRDLRPPLRYAPYLIRPLLIGLLPKRVLSYLHRRAFKADPATLKRYQEERLP